MDTYKKKYKEALERATRAKNNASLSNGTLRVLGIIFPELKESENEKIRKELHIYLDWLDGRKDYAPRGEYTIRDMIAWLEKQGEQKPTDNAVPKFKVGDWVTNSIETVQITGYDIDYGYQVDYKGNLLHRDTDFIEKEYHFWKIQDAKDGDVLATKWGAFIVKEYLDIINPDCVIAYCGINSIGRFDKCDGIYPWTGEKITPATKEERKLLFQKMKEAGYVWDAEKKELSRIEHKIAESEDERIRKDIISYLQHEYLVKKNVSDIEFDKWIAWIKKQDEYQPKLNDEDNTEVIKCLINEM